MGAVELEPQSEPIDLALHGLLHCVRGLLRRAPWVGLGSGVRDQGLAVRVRLGLQLGLGLGLRLGCCAVRRIAPRCRSASMAICDLRRRTWET